MGLVVVMPGCERQTIFLVFLFIYRAVSNTVWHLINHPEFLGLEVGALFNKIVAPASGTVSQ